MSWISNMIRPEIQKVKPYVPGKPMEEVQRELGLEKVIKMGSNENPFPLPEFVKEAMVKALGKVNRYPDAGCFYLIRAISKKLGVSPEEVFVGSGSEQLINGIVRVFVSPEDEVVFAEPSFVVYKIATTVVGAKCVAVPCKDYRHDLLAMAEAVTDKTKLVFICNPNNPTGTIVTKEELDEFMSKIEGKKVLVVLDEAYFEYVTDPQYPDGLDYFRRYGNVIVLRTFSKVYGLAGLRVGYGIAPREVVNAYFRVKEVFNVNVVAQAAALAALKEEKYVEEVRDKTTRGKEFLYAEFEKLGLEFVKSHTNFILVKVEDSIGVFNKLLKKGIIVRPADNFDLPGHIRVTVGTKEENERFIEALKEVLGD